MSHEMRNAARATLVVALSLAAVVPTSSAAIHGTVDRVVRDPHLAARMPATVAVLPVVTIADNASARRRVEEEWTRLYVDTPTRWTVPAEVCRRLQGRGVEGHELAADLTREVWNTGALEPAEASRMARELGVGAVLTLRVDRWEVADGGRAQVELTATMIDSTGVRLWSISGLAGDGAGRSIGGFARESMVRWDSRNRDFTFAPPARAAGATLPGARSGGTSGDRIDVDGSCARALYKLLARWSWSLPRTPYEMEPGALRDSTLVVAAGR